MSSVAIVLQQPLSQFPLHYSRRSLWLLDQAMVCSSLLTQVDGCGRLLINSSFSLGEEGLAFSEGLFEEGESIAIEIDGIGLFEVDG